MGGSSSVPCEKSKALVLSIISLGAPQASLKLQVQVEPGVFF